MNNATSVITGGETNLLFTAKVLGKYDVRYFQCQQTGFIQTETPYWLDEAYSDAITSLDLGLLSRNLEKVRLTSVILNHCFPKAVRLLDFAGGYGVFTRLMRDSGFPFLHSDPYCQNLFAKDFESLGDTVEKFDVVTAWEVFEHVPSPRELVSQLSALGNAILFSTALVPKVAIKDAYEWWYFTPETGQHVSFYTLPALQYLADELGWSLYSDGLCNHLLSKGRLLCDPFKIRTGLHTRLKNKVFRTLGYESTVGLGRRMSLLPADLASVRTKLQSQADKSG